MPKGFEWIFLRRKYINGQVHEKMLDLISHQGNTYQNCFTLLGWL